MARLAAFAEAVWLVGSAAMGAFEEGRSDLDLIAVAPAEHALEIAERLSHRSLPCPAHRLELVVYPREALPAPGPRPGWVLNLNTGAGMEDHVGLDPAAEPSFWFVIDLAIAREHGRSLLGPPPGELIGPIPREHVLAAIADSAAWHEGRPDAVPGALRGLRFIEEGTWSSKPAAAAWLLDYVRRRAAG